MSLGTDRYRCCPQLIALAHANTSLEAVVGGPASKRGRQADSVNCATFTATMSRHPLVLDCFVSLVLPYPRLTLVAPLFRDRTTSTTGWTMGYLRGLWRRTLNNLKQCVLLAACRAPLACMTVGACCCGPSVDAQQLAVWGQCVLRPSRLAVTSCLACPKAWAMLLATCSSLLCVRHGHTLPVLAPAPLLPNMCSIMRRLAQLFRSHPWSWKGFHRCVCACVCVCALVVSLLCFW